jgi:uncharacterized protein YprB with RNaseH-like and TPR domain
MSSLSDKLKSLGVQVGASHLEPHPPRQQVSLEQVIPGRLHPTSAGETYIVENTYPPEYHHGQIPLAGMAPLETLAAWAGASRISRCPPPAFAYLDIETTGLSGGTGTYAFLIGAGRFVGNDFILAQFFLRDPIEEPAQLLALEEFLAPCETLVTYNGKAFDVPILNTRFITQGWKTPLGDLMHFDLLHLSRRLWRDRLPSRTLGNIETFILGCRRTQEDVPGWEIPQLYFDYLRSGDAQPLKGVFYHNAMDVLAMAALLNHVSHLFEDPLHAHLEHGVDLVGMGRLYEDLGQEQEADQLYRRSLEHGLPDDQLWETVQRLSLMKKRSGDYESAVALWKQAAAQGQIYAFVELAKYFEHRTADYNEAMRWAQAALQIVIAPTTPFYLRQQWQAELEHRLARLLRLTGRNVKIDGKENL